MAIETKLLDAARRILYPLVRILLRNGIPSDAMTELVRQTYVDVAESEFAIDGKRQTTARISVITGLNRKEVARLRGSVALSEDDQKRVTAELEAQRDATLNAAGAQGEIDDANAEGEDKESPGELSEESD